MPTSAHEIIIGDARDMAKIADNSVQLVITSPPYWQLKDYGVCSQIGFNDSYEDYINHLSLVWAECSRVLENGCRLCINIGDQFARAAYYGRYKVIPIKTEVIKSCEALGFDYMGTIVWQKTTTSNPSGGGTVMGSYPYPRNGIVRIDYESILLFKKTGTPLRRTISREIKEQSKLTIAEWNVYFSGHWKFPGVKQSGHIAMFPPELPSRLIKMFSFVGDRVLDPFMGSGTTAFCAANLGRSSVGYEINDACLKIIREKLCVDPPLLDSTSAPVFARVKNLPDTKILQAKIAALPYVFIDPVPMNRKICPKKFNFGSVINGNEKQRDNHYYIREIVATDKVVLHNGATVRLLGRRPVSGKMSEAAAFIRQKTDGQKIFLQFDRDKHDSEGNLLCYLYLSNKTFINAHLIKSGLAAADTAVAHRHLHRFIKYQENVNG